MDAPPLEYQLSSEHSVSYDVIMSHVISTPSHLVHHHCQ